MEESSEQEDSVGSQAFIEVQSGTLLCRREKK